MLPNLTEFRLYIEKMFGKNFFRFRPGQISIKERPPRAHRDSRKIYYYYLRVYSMKIFILKIKLFIYDLKFSLYFNFIIIVFNIFFFVANKCTSLCLCIKHLTIISFHLTQWHICTSIC
jgi:hypothetical protein